MSTDSVGEIVEGGERKSSRSYPFFGKGMSNELSQASVYADAAVQGAG